MKLVRFAAIAVLGFAAGCSREKVEPVAWTEEQNQQIELHDKRTTIAESAVDNDPSQRGTGRHFPEDVIEP